MPALRTRAFAVALGLVGLLGPVSTRADDGSAPATTMASVPFLSLLEGAKSFDGATVVFQGEAIGQAMVRGTMAWVNVTDSGGAIGIWMSAHDASSIRTLGSYSFRGDELRVTGTFHRACAEHGGDMDIHAKTLCMVRPGERVAHPQSAMRLAIAAVLSLAAIAAIILLRARDARRRELDPGRFEPRNGGARGT